MDYTIIHSIIHGVSRLATAPSLPSLWPFSEILNLIRTMQFRQPIHPRLHMNLIRRSSNKSLTIRIQSPRHNPHIPSLHSLPLPLEHGGDFTGS